MTSRSTSIESPVQAQAQAQKAVFTAIDLFSGAGGATQGLLDAGFEVIGAIENNGAAAATYQANHRAVHLWQDDICRIRATQTMQELRLPAGELSLLKACPPCQGFSSLAEGRIAPDDPRNELVYHTIRFVRAFRPKSVIIENVPGLGRNRRCKEVLSALEKLGYNARQYVVNALYYGVPQNRKRLIIVALRGKRSTLPESLLPRHSRQRTVREAFEALEREVDPDDPLNIPRRLSDRILERVRAIPSEGDRRSLPDRLQLECHKKLAVAGKGGASGSYARLKWDRPAPTMTTRCTTPACGPFLHPELNRPITLREAAAIQTFPSDYKFVGTRSEIERQIGNAVPVKMAASIARTILELIRSPEPPQ